MLYRAAAIAIVAFWLVMMGLLVRFEIYPDKSNLLDVPVSYVARLMFRRGQDSILSVRQGESPAGTVSIRPSIAGMKRVLDFSGNLQLQLPLAGERRINFKGSIDMDAMLRMTDFHGQLEDRDYRFNLTVDADEKRKTLEYLMSQGARTTGGTLPLDASKIAAALMQNAGISPWTLPSGIGPVAPPQVTARETQIAVHGEQLQVYEVSVTEGTAPVIDFYVTELGQIVQAKTGFGYNLDAEDFE